MRYLVTGGCGFIGSHICEALVAKGAAVRVFDNLASGFERNLAPFRDKVEFVKADVRDPAVLTATMQGVDHVFHEAALVSVFDSVDRPLDNHEINITGTLNVLMAAKAAGVKRVVLASSAAIYGNDPELPKTEDMKPQAESPYALAKIAKEYYMSVFSKLYGLQTVSLRYFNVYGPRQDPGSMYSGVISKFADVVRAGQNPIVFGDGQQTRDFVFVKDVVQANLAAMHTEGLGSAEVFNIGTGRAISLLDLLSTLKELTGRSFKVQFQSARVGDIRHSVSDITRARRALKYEPQYDIKRGLGEMLS